MNISVFACSRYRIWFVSWACALGALFCLRSPASAYVDATPTLSRLIQDSTHIVVLQVAKVHAEKRIIVFQKLADLKGRLPEESVKQRITDGLHPREPRTVLDWAEPGNIAIFFGNEKVSQICIGPYWYECVLQESPWWVMTRGRPELALAYHGAATRLRHHVSVMLSGKETVITAVRHGLRRYETVAFKQSLQGKEVSLGRFKASLTMPDRVGEWMGDARYLAGSREGGPEEAAILLTGLGDKERSVRAESAENLGRLGPLARKAVPILVQALKDPDGLVRIRAAAALLRLEAHQEAALNVLLLAMKTGDVRLRKAGADSVGQTVPFPSKAVPVLIDMLKCPEPELRCAAVEALGQYGPDAAAALQPLLDALKDSPTRLFAVDAFGRLGDVAKPAVPDLVSILRGADPSLRGPAAVAILRIEIEEPKSEAIQVAIPYFVAELRSKDPVNRWRAIYCFKWLGSKAAVAIPALHRLAQDEDPRYCAAALESLGVIGPVAKEASPTVRERLQSADGEVRLRAAEALWRIEQDTPTAVAICIQSLQESTDDQIRVLAGDVLGEIGPGAKAANPVLLKALQDADRSVRWAAAGALGGIGPETAGHIPDLLQALQNEDPHVRARIAELLGKLGDYSRKTVPALFQALNDRDRTVRVTAAEALVKLGSDRVPLVPVLIDFLNETDSDFRTRTIDLLGQMGPDARPAVSALSRLLQDEDSEVSDAAAEALKKIGTSPGGQSEVKILSGERAGTNQLVIAGAVLIPLICTAAFFLRRRWKNARHLSR